MRHANGGHASKVFRTSEEAQRWISEWISRQEGDKARYVGDTIRAILLTRCSEAMQRYRGLGATASSRSGITSDSPED